MSPTVKVIAKGREQQPVVVVDDFFPRPEVLLEDAATRDYTQIGPFYPGIRSNVPDWYPQFVLESLKKVLSQVFGYAESPVCEEGMYSLVTTKPSDLMPVQLFPHYDGVEPDKLAVLHYLCGPEMGGTSFYRHRTTGFETVDAGRFETFRDTLENEISESGVPEPRYIDDSTDLFEKIWSCEAKFNRLVIYRGINLHSASVSNDVELPADTNRGRLTVNTFLNR